MPNVSEFHNKEGDTSGPDLGRSLSIFHFCLLSLSPLNMDNADVRYPKDCKAFMLEGGPSDPELVVPGGKLVFNARRDERFPYIYEVASHPLVDEMEDKSVIRKIWVYVQDTSKEGLKKDLAFEETLYVPLGPDSSMKPIGALSCNV